MTLTRRRMIGWTASLGGGLLLGPQLVRAASPNSVVRHAAVGVAGMGWGDIRSLARHSKLRIVALCDVDEGRFGNAANAHPDARRYKDWREMLDREHDKIDSVSISTPDHMHAIIAMATMQLGKHLYCQKPLAKWLHETRRLTEYAATRPIVTQLGTQHHSGVAFRMARQMVQDGVIGKVKRAHTWSNKRWGGGQGRPAQTHDVPDGLDWDLWLGVAPKRPYTRGAYHPGDWRNWMNFGCGLLGDMAAHIFDPVIMALELGPPLRVHSTGPKPDVERWPASAHVQYHFAPTRYTATDDFSLMWYDGDTLPPQEVTSQLPEGMRLPESGSMMIGEEGAMLLPHVSGPQFFPQEKFAGIDRPRVPSDDHYRQYVNAILGEGEVRTPFAYGGQLTETILIGTVSQHLPDRTLQWDAQACRFDDAQANGLLSRPYRDGWSCSALNL